MNATVSDSHEIAEWTPDPQLRQFGVDVMRSLGARSAVEWVRHLVEYVPRNPKLLECTPSSVAAAISHGESSQLSIGVDYYVIPRKNSRSNSIEATFQIGVKGAIKLATRGSRSVGVQAHVVTKREVDAGNFRIGHHLTPPFEHWQDLDRAPNEESAGAYAAACTDGVWRVEWMSIDQLKRHAEKYGGRDSPWQDEDARPEMYRKTVMLRLCKQLPLPDEAHRTFAADGEGVIDLGTAQATDDRRKAAAGRSISSAIAAQLGEEPASRRR